MCVRTVIIGVVRSFKAGSSTLVGGADKMTDQTKEETLIMPFN